jgi:hypothetical protein
MDLWPTRQLEPTDLMAPNLHEEEGDEKDYVENEDDGRNRVQSIELIREVV